MSFDRRVHQFDQHGRMIRVTPYREHIRNGMMTLVVLSDGKLITPDGAPYPVDTLPDDLKTRYATLIAGHGDVSRETPSKVDIQHKQYADETPIHVDLENPGVVDLGGGSVDLSGAAPSGVVQEQIVEEPVEGFSGVKIKRGRGRPPKVTMPA